jgi:ABC-type transporter Mla subunit MlaD
MGDKAFVIDPGESGRPLDITARLDGKPTPGLNDVMQNANRVLASLDSLSTEITENVDVAGLAGQFESTLDKLENAVTNVNGMVVENRAPLRRSVRNLDNASSDMRNMTATIDTILAENDTTLVAIFNNVNTTTEKISAAVDSLHNAQALVDTIHNHMENGTGTFAKLIQSDDLYEELRRTNANIDSFVVDFQRNPKKYTKDMVFKVRLF